MKETATIEDLNDLLTRALTVAESQHQDEVADKIAEALRIITPTIKLGREVTGFMCFGDSGCGYPWDTKRHCEPIYGPLKEMKP